MTIITLAQARTMIATALEFGVAAKMNPLSAVVLDGGGNVIAFERSDNAAPGRFAIAHGKAYGAVMLGMAGRAQMARAEQQAYFMAAINGAYGGQTIPVPGGVLIRESALKNGTQNGPVIGAIGVTGDSSENDADAALAGIAAAGFHGEA